MQTLEFSQLALLKMKRGRKRRESACRHQDKKCFPRATIRCALTRPAKKVDGATQKFTSQEFLIIHRNLDEFVTFRHSPWHVQMKIKLQMVMVNLKGRKAC